MQEWITSRSGDIVCSACDFSVAVTRSHGSSTQQQDQATADSYREQWRQYFLPQQMQKRQEADKYPVLKEERVFYMIAHVAGNHWVCIWHVFQIWCHSHV